MLKGIKGVDARHRGVASGHVTIGFDERLVSEKALREFIVVCGFSVA